MVLFGYKYPEFNEGLRITSKGFKLFLLYQREKNKIQWKTYLESCTLLHFSLILNTHIHFSTWILNTVFKY